MRSLFMAVSDVIASLLFGVKKVDPPIEPKQLAGYTNLYFHCWLCDGKTDFAYKNASSKREFTIECARCGVENRVTLVS